MASVPHSDLSGPNKVAPRLRLITACVPLPLGALLGGVAANGHFRLFFGWSVSVGWPLLAVLLVLCGLVPFLREARARALSAVALVALALVTDLSRSSLGAFPSALVGIGMNTTGCVVGVGTGRIHASYRLGVGLVSTYINAVFFFNLFQAGEAMRFFGGGEIV
jgi:hypothetical protein